MQARRLEYIDCLRGIAALCVLQLHTVFVPTPPLQIPSVIEPIVRSGASGVLLFCHQRLFALFDTVPS